MSYDVIVLGLGGMGSAAAYQLAARGQRVLGLERHTPAHALGSSHGQSRITRQAYFEDPAYVPLLLRAYELWDRIEAETGRNLLNITGGLMIGPPDSHIITGSQRSAETFGLRHEMLDAQELQRCYPMMRPTPDTVALFEYKAGFLRPEACVQAHLDRAAQLGATLHFEEPALAWEAAPSGEGVRVTTAQGTYEAGRLIVSPGPWAPQVLADLGIPLTVERQVMYWFEPVGGIEPFALGRFPIYIWQVGDLDFYGFPASDGPTGGVKVAFGLIAIPGVQYVCTPETIDRQVHPVEIDTIRHTVAEHIPDLAGQCLYAKTCMYTATPDRHFIITTHPAYPQVAFAAGFSGHGFKFTSVVGEILADLATEGKTQHPIDLFNLHRLTHA